MRNHRRCALLHCHGAWVIAALVFAMPGFTAQVTLNGPLNSGEFGKAVTVLPNGNFVVTDPGFDLPGPINNVGAVYLYRSNGVLISTLTGSTASNEVGSASVTVLTNGNFVVRSPNWDNGAATNAGAATWIHGQDGLNGSVSSANSLVGTTNSNEVGATGVIALANGHYAVQSASWDNGTAINAGAITWGNGLGGVQGTLSAANSLVGSATGDGVGTFVTVLSNGNFVVASRLWNNGAATDAGAATWVNAAAGIAGTITESNSLVGSSSNDSVGDPVVALTNGNYVVRTGGWDNAGAVDAGAVTWGDGATGTVGTISTQNSLVGTTTSAQIGTQIAPLSNGNYVVASRFWSSATAANVGAATWGNGSTGIIAEVSAANSLTGGSTQDGLGGLHVTALTNGNYVLAAPGWDNGAAVNAGSATWGDGNGGTSGPISATNSLVGSSTGDRVGNCLTTALSNGNYVVCSVLWSGGVTNSNFGAVTWRNGSASSSGLVSAGNSLVGTTLGDAVGIGPIIALSNGNYVVGSRFWDDGSIVDAGAASWGNGIGGTSGAVSSVNSLIGTSIDDQVGDAITALSNDNYVVTSTLWDNGGTANVGAVTWAGGTTGLAGPVTQFNSLSGNTPDDQVGVGGVTALSDGNFLVESQDWDSPTAADVGAATWGDGTTGTLGMVSASNSLIGTTLNDTLPSPGASGITPMLNGRYVLASPDWNNGAINDAGAISLGLAGGTTVGQINVDNSVLGTVALQGSTQVSAYDDNRNQLIVGQPRSNRLILHRPGMATSISIVQDSPDPSIDNQLTLLGATVSAGTAPADGRVTFTASSGESCIDPTPTITSPGTADFSCTILFASGGPRTIYAEYTGSSIHAFSGSGLETHTANIVVLFSSGFE